jgi:hypothetical protein
VGRGSQDQSHDRHSHSANRAGEASHYRVVETRYRTSKYFLADQLRYSEAVNDFRSVRASISHLPQMNLLNRLQFALDPLQG